MVETNVESPTDIRLLFDAIRKSLELLIAVCKLLGWLAWQEGEEEIRQFKKLLHKIQRLKGSSAKAQAKREGRQQEIIEAHQEYLLVATRLLERAEETRLKIEQKDPQCKLKLLKIGDFFNHARRQINPIIGVLFRVKSFLPLKKWFRFLRPIRNG